MTRDDMLTVDMLAKLRAAQLIITSISLRFEPDRTDSLKVRGALTAWTKRLEKQVSNILGEPTT